MTVAVATKTVEVLSFPAQNRRAAQLFEALTQAALRTGLVTVRHTERFRGESDWLMVWGGGALDRFEPMAQQKAKGGRALCWDLAYWQRDQKARVSIDHQHPQAWVMQQDWPAERLEADGVHARVTNTWNPDGPVVVAGIGPKALLQYGGIVEAWEAKMIAQCRARGLKVVYKPKKSYGEATAGVSRLPEQPIERALDGASLLVTWHSNAAVDAIRHGIPVICQDGAAAAVCLSRLPDDGHAPPLAEAVRERFLRNLAWFQWAPTEAVAFWKWAVELLA